IFGDFEIKDLDKKAENKKLVRRFLTEIFQNGELEQWSDYVADDLIQHNHEIGQGSAAYKNYVSMKSLLFEELY
ncbi:ester cyclase, partial [Burkholderia contaminans]|nr:ester cyclase [Burkholderia contaminans]